MIYVILIGVAGGIFSGLLGIGAGTVFIPGILLLGTIPQQIAQGTALGAMVPLAVIGFLIYRIKSHIAISTGLFIISGSVIGAIAGASIAVILPPVVLKLLFALFMLIVGVKMIISAVKPTLQ